MRCAIYTRKSSSDGLDGPFTSLDAQREVCEAYIASQKLEGWITLAAEYCDAGISGGTLERPALQRLLGDVRAGAVDCVVVYKIDRLSRSLRDFLGLIDLFERHGVQFVAITQSFSTLTSMGRLTLNVLLSFAQFEREITSERLKDKFAASKRKGLWLHGRRPYGYQISERKLVVDEAEALIVKRVYRRYLTLGSARAVAEELNAAGLRNRDGLGFTAVNIRKMLTTRLYRGEMKGQSLKTHAEIVTEAVWAKAQAAVSLRNRKTGPTRRAPRDVENLARILVSTDGRPFRHAFVTGHQADGNGGLQRHRIYRDGGYKRRQTEPNEVWPSVRYRAEDVEQAAARILAIWSGAALQDDTEQVANVLAAASRIVLDGNEMLMILQNGVTLAGQGALPRKRMPPGHGRRRKSDPAAALARIIFDPIGTRMIHVKAPGRRLYQTPSHARTDDRYRYRAPEIEDAVCRSVAESLHLRIEQAAAQLRDLVVRVRMKPGGMAVDLKSGETLELAFGTQAKHDGRVGTGVMSRGTIYDFEPAATA